MGVPRPGTSGTGGPRTGGLRPGIDYIPNMPDPGQTNAGIPYDGSLIYGGEPQQPNNMADYYDYLRQFLASQQESI